VAPDVEAQPGCVTVLLPDLAPSAGTPTASIASSVLIAPVQGGNFAYPFNLVTKANGTVYVSQTVGQPWAAFRQWTGVRSVSIVSWYSAMHGWQSPADYGPFYVWDAIGQQAHVYDPGSERIRFFGYKQLPTTLPADGSEPTWAYRTTMGVTERRKNDAMSLPIQLGETWNVGVMNTLAFPVWVDLQIEARICL
jgi:hypothetical protein